MHVRRNNFIQLFNIVSLLNVKVFLKASSKSTEPILNKLKNRKFQV